MNVAIILAGGSGKRMGAGKNKVFLEIGKRPILFHTLKVFENVRAIDGVILVIGEKDRAKAEELIGKYGFKKIIGITSGGKERQDSAYNGLKFFEEKVRNVKNSILLFHNAANPFVSAQEITNSILEAEKHGAAVVARKTKDTIRKVDPKNFSLGVVDRSNLWNMQTPQTIRFSLAKKAFEKAFTDDFLGTDDVSLVERMRRRVKIIEASENNFKITTPIDLALSELILKNNKK